MINNETASVMRSGALTAFSRCFSDIPNAQKLFFTSLDYMSALEITFQPQLFTAELAVELEARYKSIDVLLEAEIRKYSGECVVLEIGSGLTTRKINFYSRVKAYYEIDYYNLIQEKNKLYQKLGYDFSNEGIGIDLLEEGASEYLKKVLSCEKAQMPVIIVNEGLFWYLTRSAVDRIAKVAQELISKRGGCWITGDCPVDMDFSNLPTYRTVISESAGKKMNQPFETYADFEELFLQNRLGINRYHICDLVPLKDNYSAKLFAVEEADYLSRVIQYCDIAVLRLTSD